MWRVQGKSERHDIKKGQRSAKLETERGKALENTRGVERRGRDEDIFTCPSVLREKLKSRSNGKQ